MLSDRYRVIADASSPNLSVTGYGRGLDQLAFTTNNNATWIESVDSESRLSESGREAPVIHNAESPALAFDGQRIAYLRPLRGRGGLVVKSLTETDQEESALTPDWMNVEEATFAPDGSLIVAAIAGDHGSALFRIVPGRLPQPLLVGEARYPAVSADGQWLAYSRMQSGVWNLHLLGLRTGVSERIATVACNQIQPSWEADSKTLLYASDCGRALWLTAICRRKVIP